MFYDCRTYVTFYIAIAASVTANSLFTVVIETGIALTYMLLHAMESLELKTVHFYVLQDTILINYFIIW